MDAEKYTDMSRDDASGKGYGYYIWSMSNYVYMKRIIFPLVGFAVFRAFPTTLGSVTVVRSKVRL